ncbi:MAG TPA: 2-hydroxychromene-2-carboxylate isomerase [Gammaproteobacteria bacterium]|jgi:2-hydroxychromene-2-carboxylate isomerase|nr:2-hydroxychromene-2-carboxylate isomerase [Gammaproteobacteria bacterium]HIK69745.1 2-hydroxychromene-2-carboxylate isomerase [Pseudomonadales bacterium]
MQIEFHFDFGSPNAYLSHLVIPQLEQRTGVSIKYLPILLGGVFKATNNVSPAVSMQGIKNKGEYAQIETQRFVSRHNITAYNRNPFFPVNTLQTMRGAVYADQNGFLETYVNAVYHHMWSDPKKMDDPEVMALALTSSGLPTEDILAGIQDPDIKKGLITNTERSVAMGTFGSPTFFVDSEIFFGKDKLDEFESLIKSRL